MGGNDINQVTDAQSYNQILLSQMIESLGRIPEIPARLQSFFRRISDTYTATEQTRAQLETTVALRTEQLIASTSRAYSFLDSLNMGLIMCDVNPEVVLTNLSVRRMFAAKQTDTAHPAGASKSSSEWTLDAIDTLFAPDLHLATLIKDSLARNHSLEQPEVHCGPLVLRFFIAPMVNEVQSGDRQQIGAVMLVEDITDQKLLERSKDEFLSIASHELRTPLTAIRGNASMIKKYYADSLKDADMAEMIDDIHTSAIRLISIVNDFLDVSALEQGKMSMHPASFALGEVAREVSHEVEPLCIEKNVALVCDASLDTLPPITADRQRIKQVIYNLVGNALKFTEHGTITIAAQVKDRFVHTTVADTGRGMSAEGQRLLFRKFQQASSSLLTRDTTKGTGLGLYISKLIIEQSGGTISLQYSEVGKGSTFMFSLPCSNALPVSNAR